MLLWKRGPFGFSALALAILAANLALNLLPAIGIAIGQGLIPLAECSLLYASLAADRGDRPRLRHLAAIAGASPGALAAVVVAGAAVFGAEALVAMEFGGIDMLAPAADVPVSASALIVTYAAGMLVSLPLTFVPFAVLFDGIPFGEAFAQSFAAFARNPGPLAVWGALSFGLLMLGLLTDGVGLLLALPWSAAASYAAWKDIFGVS
ncbi:MAG TPA: hypothetical protein VKT00_02815 [Casimicrobiaceae bacterium]|nr:hypothetical protein [Casimicrobiaceae bacterium]